jgi:hypothetical protein
MKRNGFIIALALSISLFIGCEDFFEKDIESSEITLNSPADSARTEVSSITFWWEPVNGATSYQLQVASPNFAAIVKPVLDTTVGTNKFIFTLVPGKYEWRVRALNSAYATGYFYSSFQIDSTLNLTKQEVVLVSPVENYYTNVNSVSLKWEKLYNALEYQLDIKSPDWNGNKVTGTKITPYDTAKVFLAEGKYAWGVRASNDGSVSVYSFRNIMIDKTAPTAPSLVKPTTGTSFPQGSIDFGWTRASDNGSPLYDSLYLSTDSAFTVSGIKQSLKVEEQSVSIEMKDNGTYFWKVKSVDKAGNRGTFSVIRKFKITSN